MSQDPDSWTNVAVCAVAVSGVEILLSSVGVPGLATGAGIIVEHLVERRRRAGEEHIEIVIAEVGGEDKLLNAIMSDDERNELLWSSVQATMATGVEGKRIYLAHVVANAMTGDRTVVDDARLVVDALTELDGPHIEALIRIRAADDASHVDGFEGEVMDAALDEEREPILAALVRAGVVLVGSQQSSPGLFSATSARNYTISGVNQFGRRLLADLESIDIR